MPEIQKIRSLQRKLESLKTRYTESKTLGVVVGYTAFYGIYVHERPAHHNPGQQWKFLEQPAREMGDELGQDIAGAVQRGTKLLKAMKAAGVKLQRASEEIVPVDTGNLRGSSITATDDELESVWAASVAKLLEKMQKQSEQHAKKMAKNAIKRNKAKEIREKQRAAAAKKTTKNRLAVKKLKGKLKKVISNRIKSAKKYK
jgi:hypothetical protein